MENLKESGKALKSFCKINLFLKIISKRKDGYHNIFSYFLPVNLFDEMFFEEIKGGNFKVETYNAEINEKENIVYKAGLELLKFAKEKKGIKIKIYKNISLGSGLGGGSSNCAVAIKFLNKFWKCNLSKGKILEIALKMGSDVPFFIEGKPALVEGRGEIISFKKIKLKLPENIILFIPSLSVSTKDVYNAFDKLKKKDEKFDKNKYLNELKFENLENDLQDAAFFVHPELKIIYNKIKETKPLVLLLSGSGSAFWGFYKDIESQEKAKRSLTNFVKFYIVSFTKF